jgi:ribosomal protein L37AE/L43A
MHDPKNVKLVKNKQAKETYQYRNIKEKLHKTNAAIWYNKICRKKLLAPNYTPITATEPVWHIPDAVCTVLDS